MPKKWKYRGFNDEHGEQLVGMCSTFRRPEVIGFSLYPREKDGRKVYHVDLSASAAGVSEEDVRSGRANAFKYARKLGLPRKYKGLPVEYEFNELRLTGDWWSSPKLEDHLKEIMCFDDKDASVPFNEGHTSDETILDLRRRHDTIFSGLEIICGGSLFRLPRGATLGGIVYDRDNGEPLLLSNVHVMTRSAYDLARTGSSNSAPEADPAPIYQPRPPRQVGRVKEMSPISFHPTIEENELGFDGSTYVDIPLSGVPDSDNFYVEAVIKPGETDTNRRIVEQFGDGDDDWSFFHLNGAIRVNIWAGATENVSPEGILNPFKEVKVAFSYVNGVVTGYIDDVETGSFEEADVPLSIDHLNIGRRGAEDSNYFEGVIRDVKLYSDGVLIGHWPLTEGEGDVANDVSGNGHHGTIYNPSWGEAGGTFLDAAVGYIDPGVMFDDAWTGMVAGSVPPAPAVFPDLGDPIFFVGRTSGYKEGTVKDLYYVTTEGNLTQISIRVTATSDSGDSGSRAYLREGDKNPIGIAWGSTLNSALIVPATWIEDAFNVSFAPVITPGVNLQPEPAVARAEAVLPTVQTNDVNVEPEPACARATALLPVVTAEDPRTHTDLHPEPAQARATALLPEVEAEDDRLFVDVHPVPAPARATAVLPFVRTVVSPIRGIRVSPSSISIEAGSAVSVRASLLPVGVDEDVNVRWSTSDYDVAFVQGSGMEVTVRGRQEGVATITASILGGRFTATCVITVEPKHVAVFEALRILRPNFSEVVTIDNIEVLDLVITKELSGHHGIEFTLPVGAHGWDEIQRGRYVEAEGQKYYIEVVRPTRGADDIPLISVSCTHTFFETEREQIPYDTVARATLVQHLNFVLRGTGINVVATDATNEFYDIRREIAYSGKDTRFEAFQRVFAVFGGFYRLDGFNVEIIPPRPPLPVSAVVLEYGVTNESIEKREDDTRVVTILYATGGDGMVRTVYAPPEIRALYRRDRVQFVSFGDILLWNNFVFVTDQYLERRMLPRTTYTLSVAELKNIIGIDDLYPERDFEITVGKVVQVKDEEIGIDVFRLIQRYRYKPLEPDNLSHVTIGDKPDDITFEEVSREGVVGDEEGEWRYDEETGEWVFFPDDPVHDEPDGIDYTLTITEHEDSCGPIEFTYRYLTGSNAFEVSVLTITGSAEISGGVTVILDGEFFSTQIEEGDTPEDIAEKIAAGTYPGWDAVQGTGDDENRVTFTATQVGAKRFSADYRFGLTGAVGSFQTVKGREEEFQSDWRTSSLPFEQTFGEGDLVEVRAKSSSEWYTLAEWFGDGEGRRPRTFVMTADRVAEVRFEGVGIDIAVTTRPFEDVGEDTATLVGRVDEVSKFGSIERGFVWSHSPDPTLDDNQILVGSGGVGRYTTQFVLQSGDPPDQKYYVRAYARAYDQECDREIIRYGQTRSLVFNYEAHQVEIQVVASDNIEGEFGAEVTMSPGQGMFSYPTDTEIMLHLDEGSLPEGTVFVRYMIIDLTPGENFKTRSVTENPHAYTVTKDVRILAVIDAPHFVLSIEQEGGTGKVGIANNEDGANMREYRLPMAVRFEETVYAFALPDRPGDSWFWAGAGETLHEVEGRPRRFPLDPEWQEHHAQIRWIPRLECKQRCIFVSADPPDPDLGSEDDLWFKKKEV